MKGRSLYSKHCGPACPKCGAAMHLYEHPEAPGLLQVYSNCNPGGPAAPKAVDEHTGPINATEDTTMKQPKTGHIKILVDTSEAKERLGDLRATMEKVNLPRKVNTLEVLIAVNIIATFILGILIIWRTS